MPSFSVLGVDHFEPVGLQHAGDGEDVAHVIVDDQDLLSIHLLALFAPAAQEFFRLGRKLLLDPVQEERWCR